MKINKITNSSSSCSDESN